MSDVSNRGDSAFVSNNAWRAGPPTLSRVTMRAIFATAYQFSRRRKISSVNNAQRACPWSTFAL